MMRTTTTKSTTLRTLYLMTLLLLCCHPISTFGDGGRLARYKKSCGDATDRNVSYFSNSGFPEPVSTSHDNCTFTINKTDDKVCQVRIDLLDFNLSAPVRSACHEDHLIVSASNTGPICGVNTGQHMYLHFDSNSTSIELQMVIGRAEMNRTWNIKVSQISCDSPYRAPAGCLQYYTGTTGEVKSFNYDGEDESNDSKHLANQRYTVCVKNEPDSCAIKWMADGPSEGFDIAGSLGTSTTRPAEDQCYLDYIIIPRHSADGNEPTADRQCGQRISATDNVATNSPVVSKMLPFILGFFTDDTEQSGEVNSGFSLKYEQLKSCD